MLVAAFYKFVSLPDFAKLQQPLQACCEANNVQGTILLASEGVNGTIAGPDVGVRNVLAQMKQDPRLTDLTHKESFAEETPFYRAKVKLKKEIVTLGVDDIDAEHNAGTYIKPEDWNDFINDPDVVLIDSRNDYEVSIGSFKDAIDPKTNSFRELPSWVEENRETLKGKKIGTFCTGGIRCEKSTAYLKSQGFDEVYHLEGGILKYLETVPEKESLWNGECFVFDQRVSVKHGLEPGSYDQCHACRNPISDDDKASVHYQAGVSCPHCYETNSSEQKERFAERQKQIALAKQRGEKHMGAELTAE
ncbi:MAG: rhodanese-related sulfurtransferase [Gammaproteobacteria bacterium]|nr:rhodanese-related sulfurtransferase [Gammaproteobacteria bacterium]